MTPRRIANRTGFTLLEILLVLVITGILVAAIAAAINIHMRVSESGRNEVEQAQLARVVLRRIGDDLRATVPYVEPVASEAGATIAEVEAAIASAASSMGSTGGSTSTGGSASSGSRSSGSSSSGGTSSSSGGSGAQTLQKLGTLQALKPQSASSSSGRSSSSSSSGGTSGSASGSGSSPSGNSSSTGSASEATEETATAAKPGIYGDQYSLQVHVSRASRPGMVSPSVGLDAPGDVKVVAYYVAQVPGATDATGQPLMGLYRQSFDKAVGDFDASAGTTAGAAAQLLADEIAGIEFRYFDGTTWQISWDSSSGSLPTAVEVAITTLGHTASRSGTVTTPQTHRLTVAIPAAQGTSASTSTETSSESTSSSTSSSSSGTTP